MTPPTISVFGDRGVLPAELPVAGAQDRRSVCGCRQLLWLAVMGLLASACTDAPAFATCEEVVVAAADVTIDVVDARVAAAGHGDQPLLEDAPETAEEDAGAFSRWLASVKGSAQDLSHRNRLADIGNRWDELGCRDQDMFREALVQRFDEEIAEMDPRGGPVTEAEYVRANTLLSLRMVLEGEARLP